MVLTSRLLPSLALAASLAAFPSRAADRPLSIGDLLAVKTLSDLRISPSRDRIAFVAAENDIEKSRVEKQIYLIAEGSVSAPVRLTRAGVKNEHPRWSADGSLLAFLSDRTGDLEEPKPAGEEGPVRQIWLLPAAGGESRRLTNAPKGVKRFVFAPDGRSVYYTAPEAKPPVVKEREEARKKRKRDAVEVDRDIPRVQIRRAAVDGKDELVFAGDPGIDELEIDPEGRHLAYTSNRTGRANDDDRFDLFLLDLDVKSPVRLTERPGTEEGISFAPDGRSVYFLARLDPKVSFSKKDLFTVSVSGGEPRDLTRDAAGSVVRARPFSDGRTLLLTANVKTATTLMTLSLSGGATLPVTEQDRVAGDFDLSPDGKALAWVEESASSLPEIRARLAFDRPPARLSGLNDAPGARPWPKPELIHWNSADETRIEGILLRPPGAESGKKLPALLYVHGGPDSRVPLRLFQKTASLLAAEGYAVLMPNYRGSDGYGTDFSTANFKDLGGKDWADCLSGVDALVAAGIADPDRLGILGGSYGGYMTDWAVTQTDRFKAAVSEFGIFSLVTDFSNSDFPNWERDYLGGYWWDDLDAYWKRSAAAFVTKVKTPVLILHGQDDRNTFIANSKEMYRALDELGRKVEFVTYPREGHGFTEPAHRADEWNRIRSWFRRYLMPEETPAFRQGDPVALKDGRTVTVADVRFVPGYSGILPSGVFLEATLLLGEEQAEFSRRRFRPAEDVVLLVDGVPVKPAGLVAGGAAPYLVTGADLAVGTAPDGAPRAVRAVTLAFDVSRSGRVFVLEVAGFPAVAVVPGEEGPAK